MLTAYKMQNSSVGAIRLDCGCCGVMYVSNSCNQIVNTARSATCDYFVTLGNAALIKSMPISLPDSSSAFRTAFEASPAL
jgi:hypothetical protein